MQKIFSSLDASMFYSTIYIYSESNRIIVVFVCLVCPSLKVVIQYNFVNTYPLANEYLVSDLPTVQGFCPFLCSVQAYRDLVHLYRDFLFETNLLIAS